MKDLGKELEYFIKTLNENKKWLSWKKNKTKPKKSPIHKLEKKLKKFLSIPNKSRSKSPYYSLKEFEENRKLKSNLLKNLNKEKLFKNNLIHQIKYQNDRKKRLLFKSHLRSIITRKIMPKLHKIISVPTIDCNWMHGRNNVCLNFM